MNRLHKPPLENNARLQYGAWLIESQKHYALLKAFGMNRRRANEIALDGRVPALREALIIDCLTNGKPSVYDWVDTEYMEQRSNELVEAEANAVFCLWPVANPDAAFREQRRLYIMQRLGKPGRNSLSIVAQLGESAIHRDARAHRVLLSLPKTVFLDGEASEQQVKSAIERLERRRDRAIAYVKGKRASPDA